ncbi:MAG TPA: phosphodiester glycosidase family protein [Acidimicrobiales bacterium]|nr:phosphodiester glycosidase family protein [Acidimicrobiales bacterium]
MRVPRRSRARTVGPALAFLLAALSLAACSGKPSGTAASGTTSTARNTTTTTTLPPTTTTTLPPSLPAPAPIAAPAGDSAGAGQWAPAGRTVYGVPAVYETRVLPPGGSEDAGIAWMDTKLLTAQLYSGSKSPGGGPYQFTAPIQPAQAASLVAAFNGGFLMASAGGGYFTEGKTIYPLVNGAASLVINADGSVNVGAWGTDVSMTPGVIAVRQNLVPLVAGGQPTPQAASADWLSWGATCGPSSCSGPGIEDQWRSAVGVTANGALVYVAGPALNPLELAQLLVAAGVVRGMQLDINPDWPVFATYAPPAVGVPAGPSNGTSMEPASVQGPATFFNASWARDFVTMSIRAIPAG